ncbi:hypothetical protein KC360_g8617 [Hortaea werneckii]|nr:hypothetical protein KC361_g8866 [Hortaea werneckii]KAI6877854.1 hypothetical protein KC325_g8992 [Hortaea werneckii]KAI6986285.1 hypothetical protein KC359_g8810 [Hortaea werneckii]KAI7082443.1 hypothetical protein KC356_g8372 [Hortaea werneckii]KAI7140054.1 hypothetical protein KC344_g8971 [Hortaea werneckii]
MDLSTQSKLVVEPAAYFLKYCYGPLDKLIKNKISDNVNEVCAYSASREWQLKLFQLDIRAADPKIDEANKATAAGKELLPADEKVVKVPLRMMKHYAGVLTMDSARGDETVVVVVDPCYGGGKNAERGFTEHNVRSAEMISSHAARSLSPSLAMLATTNKWRMIRCKPTRR